MTRSLPLSVGGFRATFFPRCLHYPSFPESGDGHFPQVLWGEERKGCGSLEGELSSTQALLFPFDEPSSLCSKFPECDSPWRQLTCRWVKHTFIWTKVLANWFRAPKHGTLFGGRWLPLKSGEKLSTHVHMGARTHATISRQPQKMDACSIFAATPERQTTGRVIESINSWQLLLIGIIHAHEESGDIKKILLTVKFPLFSSESSSPLWFSFKSIVTKYEIKTVDRSFWALVCGWHNLSQGEKNEKGRCLSCWVKRGKRYQ